MSAFAFVKSHPTLRNISLLSLVLVSLHFILDLSSEDYSRVVPVWTVTQKWQNVERPTTHELLQLLAESQERDNFTAIPPPPPRRANATLLMLVRNRELNDAVYSMQQLEDRFNSKYRYPWVFLNDEPFTDEFKRRTRLMTTANITFGLIPTEHWNPPHWVDEKKARKGREKLMADGVPYAESVSYRNMCRFNSGFFYRHELLRQYRYYWRVEPNVRFYCDITYDPFLTMQDGGKVYGHTITMKEFEQSVRTLWDTTKEFIHKHPEYVVPHNAMGFLSDNAGTTYNLCHFWSNFEIADMEFWRGEAYSAYFDHLEYSGGFYYERWGDAPVHSIAAGLFASADQLHVFRDIGYRHDDFQHCPQGELHERGRCSCDPKDDFGQYNACSKRLYKVG